MLTIIVKKWGREREMKRKEEGGDKKREEKVEAGGVRKRGGSKFYKSTFFR